MLINFSFGNFRSFKDVVTLSMVAANITSQEKTVDENNLVPVSSNLNLLTSAAVYGANASGKSNLVAAFAFMRKMVLDSSRESQAGDLIPVTPFLLSTVTDDQPSFFEVNFLHEQVKYRYGFEVTAQRVEREWLYVTKTSREGELFTREGDKIKINQRNFRESKDLEARTRPNALFLSVVAQFNGEIALTVWEWFRNSSLISGLDDIGYRDFTIQLFRENEQHREGIRELICALDLNIADLQVEKVEKENAVFPKNMPEAIKSLILRSPGDIITLTTLHEKFNEHEERVDLITFNLESEESQGTQKLFSMAGPVLDVLKNGRVFFVDEMEARMHPLLTRALIQLFNSLKTNPKRAQLIFTTHDTNLLDRSLFRRDQIWFTEKDRTGASHLYSLAEFKVRNDASFEKDYLRGKYGAIPFLSDLQQLFTEEYHQEAVTDEK